MKPYDISCTFHLEITPSLRIWSNGNYKCHGCGRQGNIEDDNSIGDLDVIIAIHLKNITKYKEDQGQLKLFNYD